MVAKQAIRIVFAVLLALACGQVLALGLGQIQVKSKANQPLLAEIPIVSNDPAELQQLQARLASPETFARIGLQPPEGLVADLQFAVVRDNSGGLAVRVTSTKPIDQPMLTFLVEVEWAEGKLVREYSALVDPPRDAPSPSAPLIDAPQTAVADTVSRPAEAPIMASPTEFAPEQDKPAEVATGAEASEIAGALAVPPAEAASPPAVEVAVAPTPAPDEAAAAVVPVQDKLTVQSGDTLSEIALALKTRGTSLDQTMLALLRANPDAFIGNDIHRLKGGAVLRVPGSAEFTRLGAGEAAVIVRDQIERWRQARQEKARAAEIAALASAEAAGTVPAAAESAQGKPGVAGARLEIIPPAADGAAQAGTRSGASAGGEGDMLRQQQELQQTQETLAARDAEVQELKARLSDLEKLQQQQQQLITMKDSELAAAQQRLAQSNQAVAAKPAAASVTPVQTDSGTALWLGVGLVLVLVGVIGWWFARRGRSPAAQRPSRPVADSAALAAGMPNATATEPAVPVSSPVSFASASPLAAEPGARGNGAAGPPLPAAAGWTAPATTAPTWHAGGSAPAANNELRVGHERIELARAYLDLGDHDTARGLLQEIVQVGDADARAEAVRLLQELPR